MEELLFILLEFLFEFVLQFAFEFLVDFGLRAPLKSRPSLGKPWDTIVAVLAYSTLSYCLGLLSVGFFPNHFIRNPEYRIWNVIITPVVMGVLMGEWGRYLKRNGKKVSQIDSYALGYFFALIFALVRYRHGV